MWFDIIKPLILTSFMYASNKECAKSSSLYDNYDNKQN